MKNKKKILEQVVLQAQKLEIPESLQPENMRSRIDSHGRRPESIEWDWEEMIRSEKQKKKSVYEQKNIEVKKEEITKGTKQEAKQEKRRGSVYPKKAFLAAASLLVIFAGLAWFARPGSGGIQLGADGKTESAPALQMEEAAAEEPNMAADITVELSEDLVFGTASYEEIYSFMLPQWESQYSYLTRNEVSTGTGGVLPSESITMEPAEGEVAIAAAEESGGVAENGAFLENQESSKEMAAVEMNAEAEDLAEDSAYGTTNIQTVGVDEGDVIKNDGRYLYQIIRTQTEEGGQAIQIVDTKEGLTQIGRLGGFENIQEFYVREDLLIVIENKYHPYTTDNSTTSRKVIYDMAYERNGYHEISFYDLEKKDKPHLLKKFTLEGSYTSSRIADGYFYGFSRYYAAPGEGETDYEAYIPQVEGKCLEAEDILLPEKSRGTSYLVLVSVDLNNPTEFVQTRAVVSTGDMYYVSKENIYITSFRGAVQQEGWNSEATELLKFTYDEGKFALRAQGEIKGQLESSFSLDEYDGYLRAVTTVREYNMRQLKDDRTGKSIGYELLQEKETNSLYVLDENLTITGSIEGLAEDERIYSARFFDETGYFVTFRQTDPLYAVDLSDPAKPEILSELKISGFSEYLHLYGTNRLLGIGMEADEETGTEEGMKLSMFDISDPTNVKEAAKLLLKQYDYSEALYNHKAVLISPEANIFGFEAESYTGGYQKKYLVFSYDEKKEEFIEEMELKAVDLEGNFSRTRGTFIGTVFYLLCEDGSITSYNRNTGAKLDSLKLTE